MSERLSKKQIKQDIREDEVQSFLITAIEKFQERPSFYVGILVGVLAGGLAMTGIVAWIDHQRDIAHGELGDVITVAGAPIVDEDARPDDEIEPSFESSDARRAKLSTAVDQVGSGVAGEIAELYRARLALDAGDTATARFLRDHSDHVRAISVRINLIHLDRQEDRAAALAERLQGELDGTAKTLPEDVLLFELAKTREALGQTEEAKDLYQQILDEYPTSGYSAAARQAVT